MPSPASRASAVRIEIAAAALLLASSLLSASPSFGQSLDNGAASPPGVGPFRLGMSLDEVKAAAPQLAWSNVMVSTHTGRVFSMRSDDLLTIGGVEFQVSALAHYYEHGLRFEGVAQASDAAACERIGLDVLTAIEPQAGPLSSLAPRVTPPTNPGVSWQTQRSASGAITVMPVPGYGGSPGRTEGETIRFGNASTVLVEAFDEQYRPRPRQKRLAPAPAFLAMNAFNRGARHSVEANVSYGVDSGPACALRMELRSWIQPPLPTTLDLARAKIVDEPSIAERHLAHAPLAAESGPAIEAELSCRIDRVTGWTFGCGVEGPAGITLAQEQVARTLARLVAFDMTGVDRDDPQVMLATVRVSVDPAARRPLDFLGAPRTPIAEVEFLRQPDPDAPRYVAPRLGGDEGAEVEVRVACRIEADGSLICIDAAGAADPERKSIIATATRVAASEYRVAPKLRTGAPSAGGVIDLTVLVQPQF